MMPFMTVPVIRPSVKTRATLLLGVMLAADVSIAAAQTASQLSVVNRVAGQVVFIERTMDPLIAARVISATDDSLLVQIGGVDTSIAAGAIRRVYLRGKDPIKNGMLIGGSAGAILGVFGCLGGTGRCSVAGATLGSAVVFGAIGAWIDHLRDGRIVVYRRR
jgi:hypothetical protein